jgi:biotin carboxyl carrier protein
LEDLRSLPGSESIRYRVLIDGSEAEVKVLPNGDLVFRDRTLVVDVADNPSVSVYSVLVDGASHEVFVEQVDGTYYALVRGRVHRVEVMDDLGGLDRRPSPCGSGTVCAPLCGLVVEVRVAPGDVVSAGQVLVVVESMKMENEICADRDGRVEEVLVEKGAAVQDKQVLVVVQ